VRAKSLEAGAVRAEVCSHWAQGGAGATQLAQAVITASKQPSDFQFLYDLNVCSFWCSCVLKRVTSCINASNYNLYWLESSSSCFFFVFFWCSAAVADSWLPLFHFGPLVGDICLLHQHHHGSKNRWGWKLTDTADF